MNQDLKPKQTKVITPDLQLCMIRFSPDGKVLAGGGTDGTLRRWDASSDQMAALPIINGHGGHVQALVFHPDGTRLFTIDSWGGLRCWPFAEPQPKPLWEVVTAHDGWVRGLALSSDGKLLATCGRDLAVRLWSSEAGQKRQEFAGHKEDVFALAFYPDGKSLVSGDLKGVVKQWDLETGKAVREFDAKELHMLSRLQDVGGARCLIFDSAGKTLAVAGTKPSGGGTVLGKPTILLFDYATGKLAHTLTFGTENDCYIHDLHFHAAGFLMGVSSGQPGTGKFFFLRPADKEPFFLASLANCHSLAVHPNGTRLAVAATNANSNGNGRDLGKGREYPGNFSPLHLWDI